MREPFPGRVTATRQRARAVRAGAYGLALLGGLMQASAQGVPSVTEERHHRVTFDHELVRVVDVAIPAGATTEFHHHTFDSVTVAVIAAQVTIQRQGEGPAPIAAARGDALFSRGPYVHRVGNVGTSEARLITIELKQAAPPSSANAPRGAPAGGVAMDNDRARASSVTLAPGATASAPPGRPAVRVVLTPGTLVEGGRRIALAAGDTRCVPAGAPPVTNGGDAALTFVDVEIK